MKLTKYEHACLTVEQDGQSLIVDPGNYTTDLTIPANVAAVVITHEHPDHFDPSHLQSIIAANPDAVIVAHEDITSKIPQLPTHTVTAKDTITFGPFNLRFFGGTHATIYSSMPPVANLGVIVNDTLFYPGDSFALPNEAVDVLALPIAAPWMKLSEAIDYMRAVKPRLTFPTHDAILSDQSRALPDRIITPIAAQDGITYQRINNTSIDI